EETGREAASHGAKYGVVAIPDRRQVSAEFWQEILRCYPDAGAVTWDFDNPARTLGAKLQPHGIPFLNLVPPFRHYIEQTGDFPYYRADAHWNREGHQVAAEQLYQWLVGGRLVPR